jgi:uncharacterized protein
MPPIRADGDAVVLSVKVLPRSSRDEIRGIQDGILKIALTSPPVDNRANDQLIRFLSKLLGVARSRVEIVHGSASRSKTIRITGVTAEETSKSLLEK